MDFRVQSSLKDFPRFGISIPFDGAELTKRRMKMPKPFSRFLDLFRSRTLAGADKFGNRYFARTEEVDGVG